MGIEIERKFLVKDGPWKEGQKTHIAQGYLSTDIDRTVRVRISGSEAFLTIKGRNVGALRSEFEYPIAEKDALEILEMCIQPVISKTRYKIWNAGMRWEVDVFHGENDGLIVAEIELADENQPFTLPSWIGPEVTNDPRYYNSNLLKTPYRKWGSTNQSWWRSIVAWLRNYF